MFGVSLEIGRRERPCANGRWHRPHQRPHHHMKAANERSPRRLAHHLAAMTQIVHGLDVRRPLPKSAPLLFVAAQNVGRKGPMPLQSRKKAANEGKGNATKRRRACRCGYPPQMASHSTAQGGMWARACSGGMTRNGSALAKERERTTEKCAFPPQKPKQPPCKLQISVL